MTDIKKLFVFIVLVILLFTTVSIIKTTHDEPVTTTAHITSENTKYVEFETYNPDINYMLLMINAVAKGDYASLPELVGQRNSKLADAGLENETISAEDFLKNFSKYSGFEAERDYMSDMIVACVNGDTDAGKEYEESRNRKIDLVYPNESKIAFDELYMLSKIITAEAGSSWLPFEWKMIVGEVLLNRVESPEYPNTLKECIYQKGQYSCVIKGTFDDIIPKEDCVKAAAQLLCGERILKDKSVVYQAGFKQGSGVHTKLHDEILGNTYLCYSSRRELYE